MSEVVQHGDVIAAGLDEALIEAAGDLHHLGELGVDAPRLGEPWCWLIFQSPSCRTSSQVMR